jgi:hypothetical protein
VRSLILLGIAAVSVSIAGLAGDAEAAPAAATDGGDVVVVQSNAVGRELEEGGSATPYSLRLPDGASCPGDTRNDEWAFQSFMVPSDVDLSTLEFSVAGPTGPRQYALYEESTQPLTDQILVPNEQPGLPGRIPAIPPLTFSIFPPGEVEGTYRIGIACTYLREPSIYWDTTIVVEADAADEPGGFTWRTDGTSAPTSSGDSSSFPLVAVVVGVGALVIAVLAIRRRTRPSAPNKEYVS